MAGTDEWGAVNDHRRCLARLLVCTPRTGLVDDEDQAFRTELYALARPEGVIPLALRALSPDQVPADLRDAARASAVHTMKLELLCRDVCQRLHAAGLRVLILKGTALAWWLYPQPHLRAPGDLDLLFESHAAALQAASILEACGHTEGYGQGPGSYEMTRRAPEGTMLPIELDIHWRLLNAPLFAERLRFDELWKAAIPIVGLGPHAFGLCPTHALLHAAMNRVVNLYAERDDNLKCLYDIHLLVQGLTGAQWDEVMQLAGRTGLGGTLLSALEMSVECFGTDVAAVHRNELARLAVVEPLDMQRLGDWTYMQRANLAALPWGQRPRWLFYRMFPPADYMQSYYGADKSAAAHVMKRLAALVRRLGFDAANRS